MLFKIIHTIFKDKVIKKLLKKIFGKKSDASAPLVTTAGKKKSTNAARVIPRADHTLSRKHIPASALNVLYRLHESGFAAYLVGGCVRDLLLGLKPKDFDIATDAHPEQVRKLFRNSRVIGRRFKLVHVVFGREIIEVSTFRKAETNTKNHAHSEHGLVVRDNAYASVHEIHKDAIRRDFTVNALYYNIADFSILDFVDGLSDLKQRVLRMIGDPDVRFREDPVRLIRAVRLAGKVGLQLDNAIIQAIPTMQTLLSHISPARLFDEMLKVILSGNASAVFHLLKHYHLLDFLMPEVHKALIKDPDHYGDALITKALENTDQRLKEHKSINPAFMLAIWYWPVLLNNHHIAFNHEDASKAYAFDHAAAATIHTACQHLHIPKRFTATMRDIWQLQFRFSGQPTKSWLNLIEHPKFRAGYDFLLIRGIVNPHDAALAAWWHDFYESPDEEQRLLLLNTAEVSTKPVPTDDARPKKRRKRRKKPKFIET